MTEKEQLLERAKALGLEFAKNAKADTIKKAIAQAEKSTEDDLLIVDSEEANNGPKETEIRAQLELEYREKLAAEVEKITANAECKIATSSGDGGIIMAGQAKLKARKEAFALKRVIVSQKDPMKQNWEGEIVTVSNDVVGDVRKYIPFNIDEGYHVPQMILNALESKQATVFINKRVNGQNVQTAKLIKAYGIEYLEPLTVEELSELASDQSARNSIGND